MEDDITEKAEVAVIDFTRTRAHELIKLQQENSDAEGTTFIDVFKKKVFS